METGGAGCAFEKRGRLGRACTAVPAPQTWPSACGKLGLQGPVSPIGGQRLGQAEGCCLASFANSTPGSCWFLSSTRKSAEIDVDYLEG